jgi:hypothetical protein
VTESLLLPQIADQGEFVTADSAACTANTKGLYTMTSRLETLIHDHILCIIIEFPFKIVSFLTMIRVYLKFHEDATEV